MSLIAPSLGARQCVRLRPSFSARLNCSVRERSVQATTSSRRHTLTTADPITSTLTSHNVGSSARKAIHTSSSRSQAAEVPIPTHSQHFTTTTGSESLSSIARRAHSLAESSHQVLTAEWVNRLDQLSHEAKSLQGISDHERVSNRIVLAGSSLSQTHQLLAAMLDEPLREISGSTTNEAQAILSALARLSPSTPFTVKYAPGPMQLLDGNVATLDRHWLQQSNAEITILLDPSSSESTYDLIYDSQAAIFVTDDYALSRSAHRSRSTDERGNVMHELLSRFAAKPNVHLSVNSIIGSDYAQILDGLEAATGAAIAELLVPNLVPLRISDALAANAALRQALDKSDQQSISHSAADVAPTAYWDDFSALFRRSNIGSLISLVQALESANGSNALVAQSSAFLLQHCLDEALATVKRNLACLYQLRSLATEANEKEQATLSQSLERIWPRSNAYSGQLSSQEIKVWRPASPGSSSAVDEAMKQTDAVLENTFDTKLQWWKLIWKVDDIRKELELACASFAAPLESDLAYESGRLATLQVEQIRSADRLLHRFRQLALELSPSIASASRDIALLTNEADARRSAKLRTIEPSTLMEPIHRRRDQLLQAGGPIDVLASKSRRLAVTSSAAMAVTAAGVGSASVLGSSLGFDASSAALALDPSTGLGLGILTLTLVGWRMQGQFNKFRRRFRGDWQRLSEGLDQDLKANFESVLRQQITGPSHLASSRILSLCQAWASDVQQQENHVRAIANQNPRPLDPSDKLVQEVDSRVSP